MLAGLGAVGLASAGAGLGTSAFFSDSESFAGNTLVAGELDLKVDWQVRYFSGQPGQELDEPTTWAGLAAFPDSEPDGVQDPIYTRNYIGDNPDQFGLPQEPTDAEVEAAYRAQFADRGPQDPAIVQLDDLKPGDCGDLTLSMHLFDNPGYIWMRGALTENAENGVDDAEVHNIADGAEDDDVGSQGTDRSGELADAMEACLFYDRDCDNQFDDANQPCVAFVIDTSDSMAAKANVADTYTKLEGVGRGIHDWFSAIVGTGGAPAGDLPFDVAMELFAGSSTGSVPLTRDYVNGDDLFEAVETLRTTATSFPGSGANDMANAITDAADQLALCDDATTERIMVIITNGVGVDASAAEGAASQALADDKLDKFITLGVGVTDSAVATSLDNIAGLTPPPVSFSVTSGDDAEGAIDATTGSSVRIAVGDTVANGDEKVLDAQGQPIEGSLREVLDAISGGVLLDGQIDDDEVVCFGPDSRRCVALTWCLPLEVGNEVQSDSVEFDVSFYAEQCRNNPEPANPFAQPS